mgnify:CR=1 FL=1
MKPLKFKPHLVGEILEGKKTSTWRLFDDKDLQMGDELLFINAETGEEFGTAKITGLKVKTLSTVADDDYEGHEKYESKEDMYEHYRSYYGDKVGPDSELKIISFDFKPKQM